MRKLFLGVSVAAAMLLLPLAATAGGPASDGGGAATVDAGSALVLLNGEPLATYERTQPAKGKKIEFSSAAVKSYRAHLAAQRNEFKKWLRANAGGARVVGEFDLALNAVSVELNGVALATLRSAPLVAGAELQGLYRPLGHQDPDLALVSAFQAWTAGGGTPTAKGAGVKVAIVDSGIDITHPCFSGGPTHGHTNAKVIHAGVYYMKNRRDRLTPADLNGHGTHVAGTVACNEHTPAAVSGVAIPYAPSGVAPAALLGNFNVFPGAVGNARSEDIVDALEDAYELGFDVANMSLGGGSQGFNDLLAKAVDNLDRAGMVVAVAAGNSGPGFSTIESPGKAARALTAGASSVGHFVGAALVTTAGTYGAAVGDFATVAEDTTAPLGVVKNADGTLSTACTALPAGSLTGKIAVISRGACTFSQKIRSAQDAGAIVAIVVNNVAGDPTAMGLGGIANEPTIPAYMVAQQHRAALVAADGQSATVTKDMQYFRTTNDDIMAGFSSQGPTDVDFRVKPDVVAPGVNVLSAQPAWACTSGPCWAFYQGTSMATPHLAGIAAVVRGQKPGWSAAEVRSAIVNTATEGRLTKSSDGTTLEPSVNVVGSGIADALRSTQAKVALDPVSVSFGASPSGAGKALTTTVTLSTLSGSGPYTATITGDTCGVFTTAISGSTVTVGLSSPKFAGTDQCQATLRIQSAAGEVAHAAVYALLK
ncbi:MAG TPA: S8 family serine peptidase [Gaiellaceae bacterium]|nr:S8 family serine peptidase [Gaiellaceae bacterium]